MKQALIILGLLILTLGCQKDAGIEPGEAEATITGYDIADNWRKSCSVGGLVIAVDTDSYMISNAVSSEYGEPNSWPIPVWVRYETAPPDTCFQSANRITVLSIRKRQ